ncbi:hypothetical protein Efla_006565 [Eimeria flavescens]
MGGDRPSPPAGRLPKVRCFMLAFVAAVAAAVGGEAAAASGDGLLQGPLGVEEPLAAKEAAGVGSPTPQLAQLLQPQRRRQRSPFRLVPSLIAAFLSATITLYLLSVCVKLLREERPTYRRLAGASGGDCGEPDGGQDSKRSGDSNSGSAWGRGGWIAWESWEAVESGSLAATTVDFPDGLQVPRLIPTLAATKLDFPDGLQTHRLIPTGSLAATTVDFPDGLEVHLLIPTDSLAATALDFPDGLEGNRPLPTDSMAATALDLPDGLEVHLLIPTGSLAATTPDFPDGLEVHLLIPTLAATTVDFPDGLEVDRLIPT